MAKILKIFYLENCPYCRHAKKAAEELFGGEIDRGLVDLEWIEESRAPELTAGCDYYYVPSVFDGTEKLFEARPGQSFEEIKDALREVLKAFV